MRFLYTVLGIMIGLTFMSFEMNNQFSKAFSRSAGRLYSMGCGQGLFIAKKINDESINKCYIITDQYERILEEILDK